METPKKDESAIPEGRGRTPPTGDIADEPAVRQAETFLARGVFSGKASTVYEDALSACPDRADFKKALSICALIEEIASAVSERASTGEHPAEWRESVESLFAQFPGSADLAKCLGDVRLLDGDWEGASHAYRLAQSKGFENNPAIVESGRFALANPDSPASILAYFGELALSVGRIEEAVEFFAEALRRAKGQREPTTELLDFLTVHLLPRLEQESGRLELLSEVVRAYIGVGLMDRALAVFQEMDPAACSDSSLVKRLARYLIDQEDYRQAFDYLSRIPFDSETKALVNEITVKLEQRGEIDTAVYLLQYMNEHDLVIQEAQKVLEDRLESAATRELADLCFRSGRYDAALSHYVTLVKRGERNISEFADRIETAAMQVAQPRVEDMLCLGEFFFDRRDWRRAESFLERILEFQPDNARARELLRTCYDSLLENEPNLGRVRLRSGDLYLAENRLDEAIEEYKKVLDSPGYEAEGRRRLAAAYMRKGKPALALEQYRGLALRQSDLDLLYELHENLMTEGLYQEALEAASMIYEFDYRYRDVEERIARLEQAVRRQSGVQIEHDPKMVELIGEQAIGRYRYIEQIGSGGMGVVHKVYDIKNQCVVAMKILRESLTGSSKAIDRFFREARIAATLSHPNIVKIYDYNINNIQGKSYISMEYVDGPSLRDIIEERFATGAELTSEYIAEILFYTAQLCDALEATHLKGIIHRDIKPDNIMITSDRIVKITDFGIVHIEEATFTPTGAMIGTPRYMSPEQVRGDRIDCRSDIYAVGIILYESLIGTPPFISGDISYQHVNVPPTPPRDINPAIPVEVEAIILRCLEKDPRKRYQRAKELKNALEAVLRKLYSTIVVRFFQTRTASSTVESPEQITE